MNNYKKISKSGGITIPAALRRSLGIEGREKVAIVTEANGDITIKRIEATCILCDSYESIQAFNGKFICKSCIKKIKIGG